MCIEGGVNKELGGTDVRGEARRSAGLRSDGGGGGGAGFGEGVINGIFSLYNIVGCGGGWS